MDFELSMAGTNMGEVVTHEASNRLGNCEVCQLRFAVYTCPRCELKTCSLRCIGIHKQELECSGERDKTGYVPLSKFTNLTLLSDYRFLEDVSLAVESCKRNVMKKYTRFKRPLPPHLWRLRNSALKRKITVHFLPQHFTRHKENTTYLKFTTGLIYWKLELIFPQGDNVKINLDQCCEEDRLSLVLSQLLDYEKCPDLYKNHLKFYHACGMAGIEVLLKAENVTPTNSYFLLDLSLTLRENFEKMTIVEYPTLYVIIRDHKDEYTILDSDLDSNWVSYSKMSESNLAARSIHSSVAELKKYFVAENSEESENEDNVGKHCDPSSQEGKTEGGLSFALDALDPLDDGEEEEEKEEKEEKVIKKVKKPNLRLLKKLLARHQEEARQQAIQFKKKYLEETKERVQREWETNKAKSAVFQEEQQKRVQDFTNCFERLSDIEEKWKVFLYEKWKEEEWERYLVCNKLPNPTILPEMNVYNFVWRELEYNPGMDYSVKKTEEVFQLLNGLNDVINVPWLGCSQKMMLGWKDLRNEMRDMMQNQIDMATYKMFRKIETDMNAIDVTTSQFYLESPHFLIHLWAELITPIPSSRAVGARHELRVSFNPGSMKVVLPEMLLDVHKAMRVMKMNYDHWSDRCRSYDPPPPPNYLGKDLLELGIEEFDVRREIVTAREELEQRMKKKIANIPPQPTLSQELFAWDSEPQRVLSEEIAFREAAEEEAWENSVRMNLDEHEVNLRERVFLGGIITMEIFHQPPQPKYLRYKHDVTLLTESPSLRPVEFQVRISAKMLDGLMDDNEIEQTRRRQQERKKEDGLILVSLKLPHTVIWLEIPEVAIWNREKGYWSSESIYGKSYDEEEGMVTFKTGSLGLIGLHISRFCNLPYKDWRMESDDDDGINFYLRAEKIAMHFNIRDDKVCLKSIEQFPTRVIDSVLNVYYVPLKLVQVMKSFGIDVFPELDAHFYLSDITSKHMACERFVYQVWGLFSASFCFKYSKFNRERGRRTFVFQLREVYGSYSTNFCLLRTTPNEACILNINEELDEYSPEAAPQSEVYTNVYDLLMRNSSMRARRRADQASYMLVQTIRDFLGYVRPLGFS